MNIAWIKKAVRDEKYYFSRHADEERMNDNLSITMVEQALLAGTIIENYQNDERGASCLVAGFSADGVPIHAVCGKRGSAMVIVTVYVPRPPKFKNPYERG